MFTQTIKSRLESNVTNSIWWYINKVGFNDNKIYNEMKT